MSSSPITICKPPGCIVNDPTGPDRKSRFLTEKKPVLDNIIAPRLENTSIPMSLDLFVALLSLFAESPKEYNGMRVYFACYPDHPLCPGVPQDQEGKLTLLFVPTIGIMGGTGGTDDPTQFYHLYEDQLTQMPPPRKGRHADDLVTTWIQHFRRDRRPQLNSDGNLRTNTCFRETCSLWYSMSSLVGFGDDPGLLKYIRCMQNYTPNPFVGLTVDFACFLPNSQENPKFRFDYQLTLLFNLIQSQDADPNGPTYYGSTASTETLGPGVSVRKNSESAGIVVINAANGDTGIPCPPETDCNGSLFVAPKP